MTNKTENERNIEIGRVNHCDCKYCSNYIRTTKYTALSFLPLSLLSQFKKPANIYFLVAAILQSIPAVSPLNPMSSIAPLVFVISLSMMREGYEDLKRYNSDLKTNSTKTRRYSYESKLWEETEWKDLFVGDVVRVDKNEYFPADLAVLSSSDPNGTCFIMTSSLDGEKNLKPKYAIEEVQKEITKDEHFNLTANFRYGPPNEDLYEFNGEIELDRWFGMGAKQLLLRESQLRNTEYIIGVVVYTGADTKVMQNQNEPRQKHSQIEVITNKLILFLIACQVVMSFVIFLGTLVWNQQFAESYSYFIPVRDSPIVEGILSFLTCFVLLNPLIPISLIISLEMVKMVQVYFIDNDEDMVDNEGRYSKAFNSSINEELGQVEYVFTDKTGTLTSNSMEFKLCVLGNKLYGDKGLIEENLTSFKRKVLSKNKKQGIEYSFQDYKLDLLIKKAIQGDELDFRFFDSKGACVYKISNERELTENFMLTLSVCHDCMMETDCEEGEVNYQGPSPDEITLVDSAMHLGYKFLQTTNKGKVVEINGEEAEIEVLQSFEFDSARKRSSVIIRHDGVIKMLIKGADSIIIDRLCKERGQPYLAYTDDLLSRFSVKGFRTLCYAMKVFTEDEYRRIKERLSSVNSDPDKVKKIKQIASEVEQGLTLLGCTAVEDKLQDDVPLVIANLIDTNVKVWMLTGDKLETAENIAFSCSLIQKGFKKAYLRSDKRTDKTREDILREHYDRLVRLISTKPKHQKLSLIVEGPMILDLARFDKIAERFIKNVFIKCNSVICCRMSPKQKGDIVRFVKRYQNKITLAIGDGANDVNMIQEAHVGIGLYGKEGMRAVQASDYALVEFKGLWKLLFVHGRWSYLRIAEMVKYFFFKNIVFSLPQFFFIFYNGYSGQTIFDDFYISFYNMAFTSFPVILRAIFDQDIYYKNLESREIQLVDLKRYYHHLYYVGQMNLSFR